MPEMDRSMPVQRLISMLVLSSADFKAGIARRTTLAVDVRYPAPFRRDDVFMALPIWL